MTEVNSRGFFLSSLLLYNIFKDANFGMGGGGGDTIQKSRTHVFKILNSTFTVCDENFDESSSWVQVSNETRDINVLFSQCGS